MLLCFDSSAAHCASVLVSDGRVIAQAREEMARGQVERLVPLLEEVLTEAGASWADLSALGVCVGPGNFTGIRIAVAAARGLSLSLGIPAIGVPLLHTFAPTSGTVLALGDARQERLYAQVFRNGEPQAEIALTDMETLALSAPQPDWHVIGHRAEEVAERLLASKWTERGQVDLPALASLAAARIAAGDTDAPTPLYVRPADAAPSIDPIPTMLD